jgi:hypothetical protein
MPEEDRTLALARFRAGSVRCLANVQVLTEGVDVPEAMKMATKGSISAGTAIDALVEFDLPLIPVGIEGKIDDATRDLGYAAVVAVLARLVKML